MTDTSKYKSVTLPINVYNKLEKNICKNIVPKIVVSKSKAVCILIDEKAKEYNGKFHE